MLPTETPPLFGSANTWTLPLSLATHSWLESWLKAIEKISLWSAPRLSSATGTSFRVCESQTRIRVPSVDAVASSEPSAFSANYRSALLWTFQKASSVSNASSS